MIDRELLKKYANAFIMYEIANHGVDPRETLDGTTMRVMKDEGHKYKDIENWKTQLKAEDNFTGKVLPVMHSSILVDHHQLLLVEKKATDESSFALERALVDLYEGDDDETAFQELLSIFGKRFDILSFLFFLKDPDKYLPVRSNVFDSKFQQLGVESDLAGNCSWQKYSQFNQWIREIQSFLCENVNPATTLIDAHSFVWVLQGLELYLDGGAQLVEHQKFGKGIVIGFDRDLIQVRFGKDIKSFMKDDAFQKGTLRLVPSTLDIYGRKKDIFKPDEITEETNAEEDEKLVQDLKQDDSLPAEESPHYQAEPKAKQQAVIVKGHPVYPRDRQVARNALALANYRCEINPEDKTFIRRNTGKPYTEPHHLIPMAYQDQFDVSLDCEGNIVSLCSNCHNEIHYGRDAGKLLDILYNERKEILEQCGISVSLEQLLEMYQ